jgi:hypothetical protein
MALMRRQSVQTGKDGQAASGMPFPDDMQGCPTVWEFLTLAQWPDGKPRQLGSVLFFVDGAGLKARIMDNDCEQCAFGVIDTAEGVWHGVELMLTSVSTDWRPVSKPGAQRKRT